MSKTYNWGIIGPGKIAHKFAQDLAKLDNARLSAVASRSQDRAAQFARQYGAPHAYGSYEAMMDCPELDVVYIATPHSAHYANTMLCLEAGIPVLCEKAFAFNAAEARRMIQTAREKGVFLMEALWTRFLPTTQKILELLQSDAIGRVLSVKADFGFKAPFDPDSRLFNAQLAGGALLDIGIYPAFIAYLMMGTPATIKAAARIGQTNVDEEIGMLFQMPDGRMAHLHATLLAYTKTEAYIYGERGTIHMHTRWHEPSHFSLIGEDRRPQNFHFDYHSNGYSYEVQEVMRCLNEGLTESPSWSLSHTLELMEILDAVRAEIGLVYPGETQ